MGFYYASEKRKFDREWERLSKEYAEAGMSESAIAEMRAFDWKWFCSRRVYALHNQRLPETEYADGDGSSALFRRYSSLSVQPDMAMTGRYGWVDDISDERLFERLRKLKEADIELLTLIWFEGYTQTDVARMWGYSKSAISSRMKRITERLKKP